MQLWTRLAQQPTSTQQHHQQSASPSPLPLTGLAASLRPYYFTTAPSLRCSSSTQTLSSLSGKHHVTPSCFAPIYPTPHLRVVSIISGSVPRTPKLGSEYAQVPSRSGTVHLTDHPFTAYHVHLASISPGSRRSSAAHSRRDPSLPCDAPPPALRQQSSRHPECALSGPF
jgi:hypothetical protein